MRTALLERATTLTDSMRRVASQFSDIRDNSVQQISANVAQVNATAARDSPVARPMAARTSSASTCRISLPMYCI